MNQGAVIVARTIGPKVAQWLRNKLTVSNIKAAAGVAAVGTTTTVILVGGRRVLLEFKYYITAEPDGSLEKDGSGTRIAAVFDGDDNNEYLTRDGENFERA